MPNVYVIGALLPTGGAHMAYHLGVLLKRHFGFALFDVPVFPAERGLFYYPEPITTISVEQMENTITDEDVLIINPAFSQFLFGLRLPGKKVMYVQDFRTFLLLDCHCDLYVSVSSLVSRYVYALYGIATPIVPAFIQLDRMPQAVPWDERPEHSALVYVKNPSTEHQLLLSGLQDSLTKVAPHIDLTRVLEGRNLSHDAFLAQLGSVRYFVNMSLAEGFGLVPLEAMAMGAMVTGVDGLAGRDYLRSGENCLVSSITHLHDLPETVYKAFTDMPLARACAQQGAITASQYGYEPFKTAWLTHFSRLLKRDAHV
ncbi:MAG: glycosyltransferase [Rickettsiales bacterium]|nr:glycosyltransferase [Rickettsiales bacterium]